MMLFGRKTPKLSATAEQTTAQNEADFSPNACALWHDIVRALDQSTRPFGQNDRIRDLSK